MDRERETQQARDAARREATAYRTGRSNARSGRAMPHSANITRMRRNNALGLTLLTPVVMAKSL
jgi:hypothetical protein